MVACRLRAHRPRETRIPREAGPCPRLQAGSDGADNAGVGERGQDGLERNKLSHLRHRQHAGKDAHILERTSKETTRAESGIAVEAEPKPGIGVHVVRSRGRTHLNAVNERDDCTGRTASVQQRDVPPLAVANRKHDGAESGTVDNPHAAAGVEDENPVRRVDHDASWGAESCKSACKRGVGAKGRGKKCETHARITGCVAKQTNLNRQRRRWCRFPRGCTRCCLG